MTTPTPKSEVRVTIDMDDLKTLLGIAGRSRLLPYEEITCNRTARKIRDAEKADFDRAISKARRLPEPTDEEKQDMISQ
jgi:hypothetical protein